MRAPLITRIKGLFLRLLSRATLREWWAIDARFRRLLAERELGDIITCAAVKA
jgi:hypothetical protein